MCIRDRGLTVRPRRTGDRLERPGRPGRTVKKIMIDQKLPRHLRDTVPVLDSGGRVAAVAELGPDAAFLPRLGEPCWHITAKRKGEYFMLEKDIQEILFSEEQLAQRVKEIAGEINRDYVGQEIMLVSVLRGSFVFMADLCRRIDLPCTVDFMAVASYGGGTSSSGQVQITKDLSSDITGKNIIVVEDILDSGNTLSYLLKVLEQRSPASILSLIHISSAPGAWEICWRTRPRRGRARPRPPARWRWSARYGWRQWAGAERPPSAMGHSMTSRAPTPYSSRWPICWWRR